MKELGHRLALAIERAGLNQKAIAQVCGAHPSAVSQWVSGNTRPTIDNLLKIAEATGVSLDWLAGRADETAPPAAQPAQARTTDEADVELGDADLEAAVMFALRLRKPRLAASAQPAVQFGGTTLRPDLRVGRHLFEFKMVGPNRHDAALAAIGQLATYERAIGKRFAKHLVLFDPARTITPEQLESMRRHSDVSIVLAHDVPDVVDYVARQVEAPDE